MVSAKINNAGVIPSLFKVKISGTNQIRPKPVFVSAGEALKEDGELEAVVQLRAERHQDHCLGARPRHRSGVDENFL